MDRMISLLTQGRAKVIRIDGPRIVLKTDMSGAELLELERQVRAYKWEILVEAKKDANVIRRLDGLRGQRVK